MKSITIEGTVRDNSKSAAQLRREGLVLCNLYGGKDNVLFTAPYNDFQNLVYTHEFKKVTLKLDGKEYVSVVKEIQFHPVTDRILHIDFLELVEDKKVVVDIPLTLTGTPKGVTEGGKLVQKMRYLKVKAFPKELIGEIKYDVTELRVGKSAHVRDLKPETYEVLDAPNLTLGIIATPRALRGAALPEETAAAVSTEAEEAATEETAE